MGLFYLPNSSAFGQNVVPSDGAKLYFYEAGTVTPKTVYSDPDESTPHTNPVVADASGVFDAIFLSGTYKIVLTDKNDVQKRTEDDLGSPGDEFSWQDDFDSLTNGGDYPGAGAKGDIYRVTEEFVLNVASGSHQLYIGDFIVANKAGATGINADWNIIKGSVWIIDEDDFASDTDILSPSQQSTKVYIASQILDEDNFASDSATKAPSQQSTKKFIEDGTLTLENKTIDSADNTVTIREDNGKSIKFKYIDIGDWDMNGTASINITHGLTATKIITVSVTIRKDETDPNTYNFENGYDNGSGIISWEPSGSVIVLTREAGGYFNDVKFDQTSFNRGWVFITYYE